MRKASVQNVRRDLEAGHPGPEASLKRLPRLSSEPPKGLEQTQNFCHVLLAASFDTPQFSSGRDLGKFPVSYSLQVITVGHFLATIHQMR